MIDAVIWGDNAIKERISLGAIGEAAFHIHIPLLTEWGKKRNTEVRKYIVQNSEKKRDFKPVIKHIAKYKQMKLAGEEFVG